MKKTNAFFQEAQKNQSPEKAKKPLTPGETRLKKSREFNDLIKEGKQEVEDYGPAAGPGR